jgi:hypothetical protein
MIDLEYRKRLWSEGYWEIPEGLDTSNFDFDWRPYEYDRPYIHQFGTQHQKTGGPRFVIPENEGIKYQNHQHAIRLSTPDSRSWRPLISNIEFDYSWHPDGTEPPFIYVFGNQWHESVIMPTIQYKVSGATEKKYIDTIKATLLPDKTNWIIPDNIEDDFDYSWVPSPKEPSFIWEFGTQWQSTGGPSYVVHGATYTKYSKELIATKKSNNEDRCWRPLFPNINFDYSWHPDKNDPPYIYVFGNQWYDSLTMPTLLYRVKGATEKKYMTDIKVTLTPNKSMWTIPDDIEDGFDYSWLPHPDEPAYIWQFGTQWQKNGGPKYNAPNATVVKHSDLFKATKKNIKENRAYRPLVSNIDFDYSWHPDEDEPPYIYVFGNQWYDPEIMPTLLYRVKGATEKKYINDIKVTLTPDRSKWIIPDDIDDSTFDYSWCPNPLEPPLTYVFGTQHQRTGGPIYPYKEGRYNKYIDIMTVTKKPNIRNWRFIESIDKESFDFSWHPDETEESFNHIVGTKFHTPEIMPALMYRGHNDARSNKYNTELQADLKIDKIVYEDSIFDACMENKFTTAYVHFVKGPNNYSHDLIKSDNISVHLFPSEAIIPRAAVTFFYDKITDYDYVIEHKFEETVTPLDIIFFSNGEACADSNYEHLLSLNLPNRIVRIDKVKGRVASQHAAANASNTPWYFLVNAKLKVRDDFDFNWQPNIYKSRRHYIFRATNPVNGLVYGHQAIVANNKKLTLNTVVRGLDFTMDSPTEVVDINSGTSMYNSSPYDTWRTAFREMIKLCCNTDQDSIDRSSAWLNKGNGDFGEYSKMGARDAVDYYNSVDGNMEKLMLSYDWEWLHQYYQNNCI